MKQRTSWTAADVPSRRGRVHIVTGAGGGLGLATTRVLANAGAHVILAVRDEEKARRAVRDSGPGARAARTETRRLDLADPDSVRAFAEGLIADGVRPDVLVNNAGVMAPPRTLTPRGRELQFATNHLGHFALTGLLLEAMTGGGDPRIVTVTSANHRKARIFFDDLTGERKYSPMGYYNQSKLANAVFGWELHRRLSAAGSPVRSVLAHPGYTATNLQPSSTGMARLLFGRVLLPLAQSADQGALPQLYAATAGDVRGGDLIGPDGAGELRGAPTRVELAPRAADAETGARLWRLSEDLTGVRFPSSPAA